MRESQPNQKHLKAAVTEHALILPFDFGCGQRGINENSIQLLNFILVQNVLFLN